MATKTAQLELINPYAKYGLKRRPTFNEIVGLISANEQIYKPFPDRRATQFKNSPQGSFFDGADSLELLKEQQNRIMDRQMREMLMRRQTQQNGGTFHLQRHCQGTGSVHTPTESPDTSGFNTPTSEPRDIREAELMGRIQALRQQEETRRKEVAERHGRMMTSGMQTVEQFLTTPAPLVRDKDEPFNLPEEEDEEDRGSVAEPEGEEAISKIKTEPVYNMSFASWDKVDDEDLLWQMYVREITFTKQQLEALDKLPIEGGEFTKRDFILENIKDMIQHKDKDWFRRINTELVNFRLGEWRKEKKGIMNRVFKGSGEGKGKGFVRTAVDTVGEAVIEGGKEALKGAVKGAVVRGVSSAFGA